jgi:hypothetical protein
MTRAKARLGTPIVLLAALFSELSTLGSPTGLAEEIQESAETVVSRQEWQSRVEDARRRSEEFVARARAGTLEPLQGIEDDIKAADARALNDPSLKRGDIVSTSKGFFVFVGRDEASAERFPSGSTGPCSGCPGA